MAAEDVETNSPIETKKQSAAMAAVEAMRRFSMQTVALAGAPNRGRLKISGLKEDGFRIILNFGIQTAHDTSIGGDLKGETYDLQFPELTIPEQLDAFYDNLVAAIPLPSPAAACTRRWQWLPSERERPTMSRKCVSWRIEKRFCGRD